MGYYMGDYYAGERGDPFFGALLGLAGKAVRGVRGLLGGGRAATSGSQIIRAGPAMREIPGQIGRIIRGHPVISAAGAAGALGALGGAGAEKLLAGGACPRGFHISKHGRHKGACVRNRRMHVTNVKALRRAIRRMHGFARIAKHCIAFTSPRAPRGRMHFRAKRKKKC